ncbi:MAG TPA: glycine/betaine ABC transporter substrate-binding protein [Solibacterales bacterium]|nr:glycine/betaine ABC transporter substrate-binding protein [Bryobacterales bacterium]
MMLLAAIMALTAQAIPPWSHAANNPAGDKGYQFPVRDIDNVPDLHGNPAGAKLVLFIGGNQFFVLPQLIAGFEARHPELRGYIFYETLPPGILRKQMANHNTLTLGNMTLQVQPDIYAAGARVVDAMQQNHEVERSVHYATSDLEIMVAAGNPKAIRSLSDLGRVGVRLSMPNPQWEGVARQIGDSLRKTGGEDLYKMVYQTKVSDGSAVLTQIHHRQTPMRILDGKADAGVVWSSEVRFQEKIGNPITGVKIPPDHNTVATYAAGVLSSAVHKAAARAWMVYLQSPEAQAIYRQLGFQPVQGAQK